MSERLRREPGGESRAAQIRRELLDCFHGAGGSVTADRPLQTTCCAWRAAKVIVCGRKIDQTLRGPGST
jgi:hypothetical protein